jgi:hypothetical protein
MGKELFVGTFVHSLSIAELEVGEKSVIGVDDGKIAFVEKDVKDLEAIKTAHNYEDAKVSTLESFKLTVGYAIDGKSVLDPWIHRLSYCISPLC